MTDITTTPVDRARASELGPFARFLKATELDVRMLGMLAALAIIWVGLHFLSGGLFLTPRNLWNLSVQSASVAIMATGMVLVIVTRNIDLSVGSILGFSGMVMGVMQAQWLPQYFGIPLGSHWLWIIALCSGLIVGTAIGAIQGYVIAYMGVPAFIVTLGGLLIWRGGAWWLTSGQTVAPMDETYRLMGGGPEGSIGATWSWIVAVIACLGVIWLLRSARTQRK
uniref:ABC transporter permease subunit n=1 Tax=Tianweitania sp. TaxID=2021634 RepID=UPI003A1020E4